MSFGYLVPEFPGQTHTFFWREVRALHALGMDPQCISTRRPKKNMMPQVWAREAESVTEYLSPLTLRTAARAGGVLIRTFLTGNARAIFQELSSDVNRHRKTQGILAAGARLVRLVGLLIFGAELALLAKERGWNHVHVHSCADSAQVALFAHLIEGLDYSLTLHGSLGDYGSNQVRKWQHARFATVITEVILKEVSESLGPEIAARTAVVPMGVDSAQFSRLVPYQPWCGQGEVRVFSCGRLNVGKGHDILVHSVNQLVADGLDVRLVIAGEDEEGGRGYRQVLENLVSSLRLSDRVTLLGAVSEEVVRDHLAHTHVFALASHCEPLGVAIMEAMSMEVPVVATAAGGVMELVEDGITGLLVRPGDATAMAMSLRRILDTPQLAIALSAAGRERTARLFSSERGAGELADRIRSSGQAGAFGGTMGAMPE